MARRARAQALLPSLGLRAKPDQRERLIHLACLDYLRLQLPGALIHHSPQEVGLAGPDVARVIAKAKHLGMVVGFPDLLVLWRGQVWGFEIKDEGRKPTDAQSGVGALFESNGFRWAVVRSVTDIEDCIRDWRGEP